MYYRIEHIPNAETMQAVVTELLPLVPFSRREKALRYKHLHGQYCCLRAWQLLYELLVEHAFVPKTLPLAQLTYAEDKYGKPHLTVIAQPSAIHFSLSHTKNAIAVAIDRQPVGIDIEAIVSAARIEDSHFLERTMSADEQQRIRAAAEPRVLYTELWTQKEALSKAIGSGLNIDTLPELLQQPSEFSIRSAHTDAYAYAVASR